MKIGKHLGKNRVSHIETHVGGSHQCKEGGRLHFKFISITNQFPLHGGMKEEPSRGSEGKRSSSGLRNPTSPVYRREADLRFPQVQLCP